MKRQSKTQKRKKFIRKGLRMQLLAWVALLSPFLLIGTTWAWYSAVEREAESKEAEVMKPYYLTLLKPNEQEVLELSVGSLMPGRTKQIVFCVSNRDNAGMNMGGADFDYSMELVYTENMALNYKIYELEKASEGETGSITAEDRIEGFSYWKVKGKGALAGEDISAVRHVEVELAQTEKTNITNIINRGRYIEYTKWNGTDGEAGTEDDIEFHLSSGENGDGYESQYFLLEIEWDGATQSSFEQYEKETDVIYLMVKALQPKPEAASSGTNTDAGTETDTGSEGQTGN